MKYSSDIVQNDMKELAMRKIPYADMKDSTVLVTGASGMLTTYLIYFMMYLNQHERYNINIIALVRNEEKAWEKFGEFKLDKHFRLLVQDVCSPIALKGNIDYIIHAAGNASPHFILSDPVGIIKANTLGTLSVLEFAREAKVKNVLYTSTREVYGKMSEDVKEISEELFGSMDPLDLRACYPESKRMAETIFYSYAHQYQVPFNIARIAHSYGPGMKINNDGRVMADFISDVVYNRDIILKSAGDAERAFCYISDAVAGMLTILLKGKDREVYNIANETEPRTIREVAEMLCEIFAEKNIRVILDIPEEMSAGYSKMGRVRLNTGKAEQLGWYANIDLKAGLERTVKSFEEIM